MQGGSKGTQEAAVPWGDPLQKVARALGMVIKCVSSGKKEATPSSDSPERPFEKGTFMTSGHRTDSQGHTRL